MIRRYLSTFLSTLLFAGSSASATTDAELADALTHKVWLTVWPNHVYNDTTVHFRLNARFAENLQQELTRFDPDGQGRAAFAWKLNIVPADDTDRIVRSVHLPFVRGNVEGSLDPSTLDEGLYRVQANLILPDGSSRRVWRDADTPGEKPYAIERFLQVHREPVPTLPATVKDAPQMLTQRRLLGSPGRYQFPGTSEKQCYGRSVWDLQLHQGDIYVGYGNGFWDEGPVHIYAFEPQADSTVFRREFRIDDEAVSVLVDFDGRLFVPGKDATESWAFGNLYIKELGAWRKLRTVPNGIHVNGIVEYLGNLWVTTGTLLGPTLYESSNAGASWTRYDVPVESDGRWDRRFREIGKIEGGLLLTMEQEFFYFFKDGEFDRIVAPIVPGTYSYQASPRKMTAFLNGLVYTVSEWFDHPSPKPLYSIRSIEEGPSLIAPFADQSVRDIIVRDLICHVLVSNLNEHGYQSEILTSKDLKQWRRVARFDSAAMAYSFEVIDDTYYVGMATHRDRAIQESGNIYTLE